VASLSQGRTAAAQCGLFTYKSVPVIFEPPCIYIHNHYYKLGDMFRFTEPSSSQFLKQSNGTFSEWFANNM